MTTEITSLVRLIDVPMHLYTGGARLLGAAAALPATLEEALAGSSAAGAVATAAGGTTGSGLQDIRRIMTIAMAPPVKADTAAAATAGNPAPGTDQQQQQQPFTIAFFLETARLIRADNLDLSLQACCFVHQQAISYNTFDSMELAYVHGLMAFMYAAQQRFDVALQCAESVVKTYATLCPGTVLEADAQRRAAVMQFYCGRQDKALVLLDRALATLRLVTASSSTTTTPAIAPVATAAKTKAATTDKNAPPPPVTAAAAKDATTSTTISTCSSSSPTALIRTEAGLLLYRIEQDRLRHSAALLALALLTKAHILNAQRLFPDATGLLADATHHLADLLRLEVEAALKPTAAAAANAPPPPPVLSLLSASLGITATLLHFEATMAMGDAHLGLGQRAEALALYETVAFPVAQHFAAAASRDVLLVVAGGAAAARAAGAAAEPPAPESSCYFLVKVGNRIGQTLNELGRRTRALDFTDRALLPNGNAQTMARSPVVYTALDELVVRSIVRGVSLHGLGRLEDAKQELASGLEEVEAALKQDPVACGAHDVFHVARLRRLKAVCYERLGTVCLAQGVLLRLQEGYECFRRAQLLSEGRVVDEQVPSSGAAAPWLAPATAAATNSPPTVGGGSAGAQTADAGHPPAEGAGSGASEGAGGGTAVMVPSAALLPAKLPPSLFHVPPGCSSAILAERAFSLNGIALILRATGNFAQALAGHKAAWTLANAASHSELLQAQCLHFMGNAARSLGKFNDAVECYSDAYAIRQRLAPGSIVELAQSQYAMGWIAEVKGNATQAVSYFEGYLANIEADRKAAAADVGGGELPALDVLEQSQVLHGLGSISFALGDLPNATSRYSQSVRVREKLEPDGCELATTFDNMASIYRVQGDFREAFMACHRACRIRERRASYFNGQLVLSGPSPLLARIAAAAAVVVPASPGTTPMTLQVGTPSCALLDVATSYNNIGLVLRCMGKQKEAYESFSKCLALREKHGCSAGSAELVAVRANLASVHPSTQH